MERSGSYRLSVSAWAKMSVEPRLAGWSGLPSILVGRPEWLSTSRPVASPPRGHRGGEELGPAGDDLLGRLDPGGDLLGSPDRAAGDARQGERGPHHLQEGAAALGVGPAPSRSRGTRGGGSPGTTRSRPVPPGSASSPGRWPPRRAWSGSPRGRRPCSRVAFSSVANRAVIEPPDLNFVVFDQLRPEFRPALDVVLCRGLPCWPPSPSRRPTPWAGSCSSGWRWQSRHHSIVSGCSFQASGMWLTRPWHSVQPTPFWTWMPWLK